MLLKQTQFLQRRRRIRAKITGTATRPRLSISRSLRSIFAQLIDDDTKKTLASASDKGLKGTKTERAEKVGKMIAEQAGKAGISEVLFDRGGRKYHGRVKALADKAREGGLKF